MTVVTPTSRYLALESGLFHLGSVVRQSLAILPLPLLHHVPLALHQARGSTKPIAFMQPIGSELQWHVTAEDP